MNKKSVHIVTIFGIPIGLDPSWFLVFALVTLTLAFGYFPVEFKQWSKFAYWSVAAATSVLFFASVILHELGHSIAAQKYKLVVKSITLYVFGGSSVIASEASNPLSEFVIAIIGPLTSLALAAVFYGLEQLFSGITTVYATFKYLALINAILAVFNLIPGYPLDGGRVFRAIVWGITRNLKRATEIASLLGYGISFMFIIIGFWRFFQGDWKNGLWISFTGWFLESAVVAELQHQRTHYLLSGHTVDQVMNRECVTAGSDLTIQELVDCYFIEKGKRCVVITHQDKPAGFITLHNIHQVPRERWSVTKAAAVMTPLNKVILIRPKAELAKALEQMGADGVNQMPVIEDNHIVGMLSREDITSYLHTLKTLED
jgi:Zn-dependent protease/predicted transcriptional regulator